MARCIHKDCKEQALSLSDYCFRHIKDKNAYIEVLGDYIKTSRSIGFYLRHLEFPQAKWHNIDVEETDLAGADLSHADLTAANFKKANLTGANLKKADLASVDFDEAHLLRCDLSETRLWHCQIKNSNLAESDLEGADCLKTTFSNVRFWHVKLNGAKLITQHSFIGKKPIDEHGALSASEAYRNLKQYFMASGRYDDASWASFKEKILERRYLFENRKFAYVPSLLMSLLCGYGEKPYRVIVSAMGIIFGYSFVYYALNILKLPADYYDATLHFWDYLYFSIVTFTTVGFGDLSPKLIPAFQMLVGSEAFCGAFMIGLFVFTLTRKYTAR